MSERPRETDTEPLTHLSRNMTKISKCQLTGVQCGGPSAYKCSPFVFFSSLKPPYSRFLEVVVRHILSAPLAFFDDDSKLRVEKNSAVMLLPSSLLPGFAR